MKKFNEAEPIFTACLPSSVLPKTDSPALAKLSTTALRSIYQSALHA
jgi:hypothetical protein